MQEVLKVQVEESRIEKKSYVRPQLTNHGNVEVQTQLTPSPSNQI